MITLDQLLFAGKLEPIKAVQAEYGRRLNEVKQKQLLSFFLKKNPGMQHKAGVPLGGTFLIVYHVQPKSQQIKSGLDFAAAREEILATPTRDTVKIDPAAMAAAFKRLSAKLQFKKIRIFVFLIDALYRQGS